MNGKSWERNDIGQDLGIDLEEGKDGADIGGEGKKREDKHKTKRGNEN